MTLHQAAEKGDVEAINAIAKSGADLNALLDAEPHKNGGLSPLAIAVLHLQNKAVEALLACGADPCFKDANGRAALSFLHRASVNGKAFEEKRIAKIIKDMISAGLKIDMTIDDDGNTLLILACKSSRGDAYNRYTRKGEIIDAALKYNPDINARNRFGETALMHACARDFETMENVQLSLLEQGADVSAADQNGNTALHYAAGNDSNTGAKTLCDMLLDFGADTGAVNNAKKTALDIATEKNNEPLVKLLLSRM
jgi:ankyrin repeat protein